jgi:hypothetical protein
MKKFLVIFGFLVLAVAVLAAFPCHNQLLAVDGCCKVRNSLAERWQQNGASFAQCENLNRKDRDNVLDQRGLVWWDMRCR